MTRDVQASEFIQRLKAKFGDKSPASISKRSIRGLRSRQTASWKSASVSARRAQLAISICSIASRQSITLSRIPRRPPRPVGAASRSGLSPVEHSHKAHARGQSDAATLEGRVDGDLPEVPTVSRRMATADWHEREVYDLVRRPVHRTIPTCVEFCARKIGLAIRCARTTRCRWNITASADR